MVYELKAKTIRAHRSVGSLIIQFWSWFNIPLQRIKCTLIPYINNNKIKLKPMTYYPLHANSSCTSVYNLTRQCYHLSKLPLKSLSYKSDLLCDRLTYSNSKEYMSNSTKWIIAIIDFMITCPLDHPKDTLSQSHEISWCLYWEYLLSPTSINDDPIHKDIWPLKDFTHRSKPPIDFNTCSISSQGWESIKYNNLVNYNN